MRVGQSKSAMLSIGPMLKPILTSSRRSSCFCWVRRIDLMFHDCYACCFERRSGRCLTSNRRKEGEGEERMREEYGLMSNRREEGEGDEGTREGYVIYSKQQKLIPPLPPLLHIT